MHPVFLALLATLFTWGMTALGAGLVLVTPRMNQKFLDAMLGFAAGVMIAASFWSLLVPALELAAESGQIPWLVAAIGFALGGVFLRLADRFLPHLHIGLPESEKEGVPTHWKKTTLLVLAITLHNIPEGLAVGVALGSLGDSYTHSELLSALAVAIGIGIQNFPEGMSVSYPLRREGLGKWKSFWYGQLSGLVEPIAGVLGALLVFWAKPILPYALAFAAGAMIYVVVEEVIPESQQKGNSDIATVGTMLGFVVMMVLDVALS